MERYDFVKLTKAMQKKTKETDYLFCVKVSWNFVWLRLRDAKIVKFAMKDVDTRTVISWRNPNSAYSKFVRQCHPHITLTLRKYLQEIENTQEIEQYYNYCMAVCQKYRVWIKYVYEPELELSPSKNDEKLEIALNNLQNDISELSKDDEKLEVALDNLQNAISELKKVLAKRRSENE